jgi:dihydroorotase-like cyclic amidohydrolase
MVIRNGVVVTSSRVIGRGYVLVKNGVIAEVGKEPFSGYAEEVVDAGYAYCSRLYRHPYPRYWRS